MNKYLSQNFMEKEFACKCGCGKVEPIDPEFIRLLQDLRTKLTKPIQILEGVRCKKYNKSIDGYIDSPHLEGKAADIYVKDMNIITLAKEAKRIGFDRVGIYPHNNFLHIDTIIPYPSESWIRDERGIYHYFKTLEEAIKYLKK